jgi:hypothetical protein
MEIDGSGEQAGWRQCPKGAVKKRTQRKTKLGGPRVARHPGVHGSEEARGEEEGRQEIQVRPAREVSQIGPVPSEKWLELGVAHSPGT